MEDGGSDTISDASMTFSPSIMYSGTEGYHFTSWKEDKEGNLKGKMAEKISGARP